MQIKRKRPKTARNKQPIGAIRKRVWKRCFWILASGVVLVFVLTRTFDYSLVPPSYKGVSITQPFCGLHSWLYAHRAWGARCHVKYGLGYTKGYWVAAVGDPPPVHPQRYVSHPPLETWIIATGMLLLGQAEWSIRLFEVILSVPILLFLFSLLRQLYGDGCALLSGLLFVLLPCSAYFAFDFWTTLFGLWALWRYLLLIGRLDSRAGPEKRHYVELAIALFLMVQSSWLGVFYALTIGLHYVVNSIRRRTLRSIIVAILVVAPVLSIGLNLHVMLTGYRWNMAARTGGDREVVFSFDRGGVLPPLVQKIELDQPDTAWGLVKALYRWRAAEGERSSFAWGPWLGRNMQHARANFTSLVLIFLGVYLIYCLVAKAAVFARIILNSSGQVRGGGSVRCERRFAHMWFFLLPGVLFLLTFKGLVWKHQYWQAPLALFVAIGAAQAISLIGDVFTRIHRHLGTSIVVVLVFLLILSCNQGLADYRSVRWQSPRTLELFKYLNHKIPPDKALLTFRDFVIQQSEAKAPFYRPEYAWYLDRDMIVANAWQGDGAWVVSVSIDDMVNRTIDEIEQQAKTGRFACYLIPANELPDRDPLGQRYRSKQFQVALQRMGVSYDPNQKIIGEELEEASSLPSLAMLELQELERRLKDLNWEDDRFLGWEKHRRYREAVIVRLKELYAYEYYANSAVPGDRSFDVRGITPCYLFDLTNPRN